MQSQGQQRLMQRGSQHSGLLPRETAAGAGAAGRRGGVEVWARGMVAVAGWRLAWRWGAETEGGRAQAQPPCSQQSAAAKPCRPLVPSRLHCLPPLVRWFPAHSHTHQTAPCRQGVQRQARPHLHRPPPRVCPPQLPQRLPPRLSAAPTARPQARRAPCVAPCREGAARPCAPRCQQTLNCDPLPPPPPPSGRQPFLWLCLWLCLWFACQVQSGCVGGGCGGPA